MRESRAPGTNSSLSQKDRPRLQVGWTMSLRFRLAASVYPASSLRLSLDHRTRNTALGFQPLSPAGLQLSFCLMSRRNHGVSNGQQCSETCRASPRKSPHLGCRQLRSLAAVSRDFHRPASLLFSHIWSLWVSETACFLGQQLTDTLKGRKKGTSAASGISWEDQRSNASGQNLHLLTHVISENYCPNYGNA